MVQLAFPPQQQQAERPRPGPKTPTMGKPAEGGGQFRLSLAENIEKGRSEDRLVANLLPRRSYSVPQNI